MSHDLQEQLEEQNEQNEHFMKEHDMVFSKSQNGDITGGGFSINSMLLKNITKFGGSPIETLQTMIGSEKRDLNKMAVPFGLFYKHNSNKNMDTDTDVNDDNEISDEIYDELLKKVNANDVSHEKSKKSGKSEKKKSRKHKNKVTKPVTNHKNTAKSSPV
jgi:hypothetical protein